MHVDHGLRPGSDADFAVVAAAAAGLGVSSSTCRVTVEAGPNLEARARDARYEALEHARVAAGAAVVLVGHTADDQAETVLLNLLRGSATAGLAAMPARQGTVVRPLLGLRRRDTLEICARLGFAPVVDPMNGDSRFRRVWLRREVLPALEAGAGRDLRDLLARQAEVMRDESDLLDALARRALADAGDPPRTDRIAALEPALARRALRQWLGGSPPSLATIDALLAVVAGERRALELPGRSPGRAPPRSRRARAASTAVVRSPSTAPPGRVRVAGIGLGARDRARDVDRTGRAGRVARRARDLRRRRRHGGRSRVAAARRSGGALRSARPAGHQAGRRRVRTDGRRPVVATAASGGVVWVVGYRIDDRVRVTSRTRRFLWMTVSARVLRR